MLRKTAISISVLVLTICILDGCATMEGTREGVSQDLRTAGRTAKQEAGEISDQAEQAADHAKKAAGHAADTLPK